MRKRRRGCFGCLGQICLLILLAAGAFLVWENRARLAEPLFPTKYLDRVEAACGEYDLDPWLIMAVIREESHFSHDAVSDAGAYGLMQLLPETAEWAARKSGLELDPDQALTDPETNIRLGVWYIHWLRDHYDGDLYAAVAAYNAGLTNVDQWLAEGDWDGSLEQREDIPFPETARYLGAVWRSYKIYLALHDSE